MVQCEKCEAKFKRKDRDDHNCVVYLKNMLDTSTDMFQERLAERANEIKQYWEELASNPLSKQQQDDYDKQADEIARKIEGLKIASREDQDLMKAQQAEIDKLTAELGSTSDSIDSKTASLADWKRQVAGLDLDLKKAQSFRVVSKVGRKEGKKPVSAPFAPVKMEQKPVPVPVSV